MGKNFPRPDGTGVVQGENVGGLPDRGTSVGCQGDNGDYGADCSQDAINRQGGIKSATKSHAPHSRPGVHNQGN